MRESPSMVSNLAIAAIIPAALFGALVGCMAAGPPGFLLGGVVAGSTGALLASHAEARLARDESSS